VSLSTPFAARRTEAKGRYGLAVTAARSDLRADHIGPPVGCNQEQLIPAKVEMPFTSGRSRCAARTTSVMFAGRTIQFVAEEGRDQLPLLSHFSMPQSLPVQVLGRGFLQPIDRVCT
jgi:hypothetical protein